MSVPRIVAVLMLSGRVHGQALSNRVCLDAILTQTSVRVFDLGPGNWPVRSKIGLWVAKALKSVWASLALLCTRRRLPSTLYMGVHAAWGQITDSLIVLAARLKKYDVVMHHQTYNHIRARDWRMVLLKRCAGPTAVHVLLCPEMATRFAELYRHSRTLVVSNPSVLGHDGEGRRDRLHGDAFHLGHLSNLTMEKGLAEVVEVFETLIARGNKVTLSLAGPVMGGEERRLIDRITREYPGKILLIGFVSGDEKTRFYNSLDAFLFPTKYKNEAAPLVLAEATRCGVPSISVDCACIPYLLGKTGVIASSAATFVDIAVAVLQDWYDNPVVHWQACEDARRRGSELEHHSLEQRRQLVELVVKGRAAIGMQ